MNPPEFFLAKLKTTLGLPANSNDLKLHLRWNSIPEAKQQMAHVRQMQKELRLLKKEVLQSMKELKSSFSASKTNVQSGFFASVGGKSSAARDRERKRQQLRQREDTHLKPYENVLHTIDKALVGLDGINLQIQSWIAERKENVQPAAVIEQSPTQKQCANCNTVNPPDYNFCGTCGTRL